MFKKVRVSLSDFLEKCIIARSKRNEIKKYKDPRRVSIFSSVKLSDEQKHQIDVLYQTYYGEKIPHTWHRHFTAFTGRFDAKYFPELLFIPEFERYMSMYKEYAKVFTDKNMLSMLGNEAKVKTLKNYYTATKGLYRDSENHIVTETELLSGLRDIGEVFIKPTVDTSSGRGCFLANFKNGTELISGQSVEEIVSGLGKDFTVQQRLKCHKSISNLYDQSVNTFRVITYRWKNEIRVLPIIMRIGSGGGHVDNAHAGGMFIAVEPDGRLHKTAFTEFKMEYTEHPDTHIPFEGYQIEHFSKIVDAAIRLQSCLPQMGCVNWDFTIDEDGEAVFIEANMNNGRHGGSIWLCEMAHGKGAFGDNTEEVLRWLGVMKKVPKSKWHLYEFGNLPDKK